MVGARPLGGIPEAASAQIVAPVFRWAVGWRHMAVVKDGRVTSMVEEVRRQADRAQMVNKRPLWLLLLFTSTTAIKSAEGLET